ncbi:MAG: hypothetical protein ACTSPQ_15040 [Candidatus Helarchaeota archaeon]
MNLCNYKTMQNLKSILILILILNSGFLFMLSYIYFTNPERVYSNYIMPQNINKNTIGDEVKGYMINGNETGFYINSNGLLVTFTNLTVFNITAGNISLAIENSPNVAGNTIDNNIYAMQFSITNDSYLGYLYVSYQRSLELGEILIWNSTWNGTDIIPDKVIGNLTKNISNNVGGVTTWIKFQFNKTLLLRTSNTHDSTFFVTFNGTKYGSFDSPEWPYKFDFTDVDNGIAYLQSGNKWLLRSWDLSLNLTLYPKTINTTAEGVNLKFGIYSDNSWSYQRVLNKEINGTIIGTWVNNTVLRPTGNFVFYNASTSWPNIDYYINYTIFTVPNGIPTIYQDFGGNVPVLLQFDDNITTTGNESKITIQSTENITKTSLILYNFTAYSYQQVVEDYFGIYNGYNSIKDNEYLMPFKIVNNCRLDAVDIMYFATANTGDVWLYVYNATWNDSRNLPIPDQKIYVEHHPEGVESPGLIRAYIGWLSESSLWNGTLNNSLYLNIENTDNNTYFVGLNCSTDMSWASVEHANDPEGLEGPAFLYYPTLDYWHNTTYDLDLIVTIKPLGDNPIVGTLGLKINNKSVNVLDRNTAKWVDSTYLIPENNEITFNVSTIWPIITFNVNASLTRQNLTTAITKFWTEAGNNTVLWNVSLNITFPALTVNKLINFTLPLYWNITAVLNNNTVYTNWHNATDTNHRYLWITDPSDGEWIIKATGRNTLNDLKIYKNGQTVEIITTFDLLTVHSSFKTPTEGYGTGFIEVYDIDQDLNYTNSGVGYANGINVTWNVRENATTNGYYFLSLKWHNNYEAGAINITLMMYNATSLIITRPELINNKIEMSPGTIFNLTLYYNMSYWDNGWTTYYFNGSEAEVVYKTSWNNTWDQLTSTYQGNWAFFTTIMSPTVEGTYYIYINASAWKNVESKHEVITLKIVRDSRLFFNDSAVTVMRGEKTAFNITYAYYNVSQGKYIKIQNYNLSVSYKLNTKSGDLISHLNYSYIGTIFKLDSNNLTENGEYEIYLLFESEQFKSQQFIIYYTILNYTTALNIIQYQELLVFNESNELNIVLYYVNTVNNSGITNATITSNWTNTYSVLAGSTNGYYNITLNISGLGLGYYTVKIMAAARYHDVASSIITFHIYGYQAAGDIVQLNITYFNVSNGVLLLNANISAKLDMSINCSVIGHTDGNYTITINSSKLTPPIVGKHYIMIYLEKENYQKLRVNITLNINPIPSELLLSNPEITAYIGDVVIFSVYFKDIHNNLGIAGTVYFEYNNTQNNMATNGTAGFYQGILNLSGMQPTNLTILIHGSAVDYQEANVNLTIHVIKIPLIVNTAYQI